MRRIEYSHRLYRSQLVVSKPWHWNSVSMGAVVCHGTDARISTRVESTSNQSAGKEAMVVKRKRNNEATYSDGKEDWWRVAVSASHLSPIINRIYSVISVYRIMESEKIEREGEGRRRRWGERRKQGGTLIAALWMWPWVCIIQSRIP